MKYTALLFGLLLIPSVSLAAPLTSEQANSLIAVVQSSTTTPANVFVPLITAFSSITTIQAATLIEVVQAAPGVPASAFVNMLIAFTVDAPVVNQTPTPVLGSTEAPPVIPTQTNTNTTATTEPVVQSAVVKKILLGITGNSVVADVNITYTENGNGIAGVPIIISASEGDFMVQGERKAGSLAGTRVNPTTVVTGTNGKAFVEHYTGGRIKVDGDGGKIYKGATITATANGVTGTIEVRLIYK